MRTLELLAPARNADIGIAAVDCGADAVYIGGPAYGARRDAGNSIEEIERLCTYAHRFGVRVYVTVNTLLRDEELPQVHEQMLASQQAGVDAFIIRDLRICQWKDITVPLHASTQCAIRDSSSALRCEQAGCSRLVLERELSLEDIRSIRRSSSAEIEFFVHGALCVCYSGECRLSEFLDGRSGDRGDCIQACRSLYDLVDSSGKVLVRKKSLLSLKDLNLLDRLSELAAAGVDSFKIEGRLKNISYVRNVTRAYSLALDSLVSAAPQQYRRASFGRVSGGFTPDPSKTFNRGYTSLFLDGERGEWACIDAAKSMGECLGPVSSVKRIGDSLKLILPPTGKTVDLHNGDGFAFVSKGSVVGFRADRCEGRTIFCKDVPGLSPGMVLYRNYSVSFEKTMDSSPCCREITVSVDVRISGGWTVELMARTEDGRTFVSSYKADVDTAENTLRAEEMIRGQLSKRSLHYAFSVGKIEYPGGRLPLLSASTLNSMRRLLASDLDALPCGRIPLANKERPLAPSFAESPLPPSLPLMRTKYCLKYELGLCPLKQGAAPTGELFLVNNGRRLSLGFDCKACEMTVNPS